MKEFIIENWYYLALLFIALLNMIILLCKKSKIVQTDSVYGQLLSILPTMIRKAEQPDLTGGEKRHLVINLAIDWLCRMTGLDVGSCREKYYSKVSDDIESILSTPQKKGDN